MEIAINYFTRQYVDEKHKFIEETSLTSKETYHHRLSSLVRDHDFVSIAAMKLEEEKLMLKYTSKNSERTVL